jgi:hypothetical protein
MRIKKRTEEYDFSSNALYYAATAAITTAIAGILHFIFASNVIASIVNNGIFFNSCWYSTTILGSTYDKAMGKEGYGTTLE